MTTTEPVDLVEEELPERQEVPEVEVHGDEAVVRIITPEGKEERSVRLPQTIWG